MEWINFFGLIIMILMLIPNIIYASKNKNIVNKCDNKVMNAIEQVGRYGSMFFMVFHIGILDFGFQSDKYFIIWIIGMSILILLYWIFWIQYFKHTNMSNALALAIIPSIIFIVSGFMLHYYLLLMFGMIFCIGHIYVTYQNNKN